MKRSSVVAVLGGILHTASAGDLVKGSETAPVSWCITYLSTYLVPVSINTAGPAPVDTTTAGLGPPLVPSSSGNPSPEVSSIRGQQGSGSRDSSVPSSSPIITNTLLPSDAGTSSPSSTATSGPDPAGGNLIFAITSSTDSSKRDLSKRALGGFVGGENVVNPDTCIDAPTFSLVSGQLLDNGLPIYYSGEPYKLFSGQGAPPDGSITTTFQNSQGRLQFVNPSLPNGQAGLCQDPTTGEVYTTPPGEPADCAPVSLTIYSVEQCLNGEIDARVSPSSTNTGTGSSSGIETSGASVSKGTAGSIDPSNLPTIVSEDSLTSTERLPMSSDLTTVLEDTSSAVSQIPSSEYSSSARTSTEENTPTSSENDSSFTHPPSTTSSLVERSSLDTSPVDSASTTESAATELSTPEPPSISTDSFLDTSTPTDPSSSTESLSMTDIPWTEPTDWPTDWPVRPTTSYSVPDITTQSYEEEPTPIFNNEFLNDHRDGVEKVTLPFPVTMYSTSSNVIYVSVNGVISLDDGSAAANQGELPSDDLADKAIAIYWTRNSIIPGSGQAITYRVLGDEPPSRLAIFDFLVHPDSNTADEEPDHYTVTFMEAEPRFVAISYIHTHDKGGDATVGHQDYSGGLHRQYSYNEPGAIPDMTWLYMSLKRDGIFESGPEGQ